MGLENTLIVCDRLAMIKDPWMSGRQMVNLTPEYIAESVKFDKITL